MKPNQINFYSLRQEINELYLDPAAKLGLKLSFIIIGIQLILLALVWHRLPPQLPLWYSRAYGEAQLASHWWVLIIPGSSLLIELVSIRLAAKIREENQLWSQMFSWTGTIAALMAVITLGKIILLAV